MSDSLEDLVRDAFRRDAESAPRTGDLAAAAYAGLRRQRQRHRRTALGATVVAGTMLAGGITAWHADSRTTDGGLVSLTSLSPSPSPLPADQGALPGALFGTWWTTAVPPRKPPFHGEPWITFKASGLLTYFDGCHHGEGKFSGPSDGVLTVYGSPSFSTNLCIPAPPLDLQAVIERTRHVSVQGDWLTMADAQRKELLRLTDRGARYTPTVPSRSTAPKQPRQSVRVAPLWPPPSSDPCGRPLTPPSTLRPPSPISSAVVPTAIATSDPDMDRVSEALSLLSETYPDVFASIVVDHPTNSVTVYRKPDRAFDAAIASVRNGSRVTIKVQDVNRSMVELEAISKQIFQRRDALAAGGSCFFGTIFDPPHSRLIVSMRGDLHRAERLLVDFGDAVVVQEGQPTIWAAGLQGGR